MNLMVIGLLSLVMLATRFPFGGDSLHLLDASWAVFFVLGRLQITLQLKSLSFIWLSVLAWVIDLYATDGGFVSSYCMTPAYLGMPLAYLALMLMGALSQTSSIVGFTAGQASKGHCSLVLGVLAASLVAFIISNAFFYGLSGYFAHLSVRQYSLSVMYYFPHYLLTLYMYTVGWHLLNRFWSLEAKVQSQTRAQTQAQSKSEVAL